MATSTKEPAAPLSSSSAATAEDEALKRNTDCVYFLASPLTCKKGSECEYRHSEYARVNPRDCWYWLNGNCLNPKCSFRHPPLDTLIGRQAGNFAGPSLPVSPAPAVPTVPSAPYGSAKQAVPCIFFQKGYCLKGDRCPFLHGPNPLSNKVQQAPATPITEPPTFKKALNGLEKCTQGKANIQLNASKIADAPIQAKSISEVEATVTREGMPARKHGPSPGDLTEEPLKYKETDGPIDNGNLRSRTSRAHHASSLDDQSFQNGRDADDGLRESSPGFDVLVDDKLRGDQYYQHEDQYVRMRGHEGRSLNEFEMGHHDDYNSVADVDPEIYHSRHGYDSYDRLHERYAWDQHRVSSERSLGEPAHYDRRDPYKSKSPDFIQNSDLRHRLSNKQRRVNGLKSVVNPDYNPENQPEDRGSWATRRESRRSPAHESSRSSRLQGRIKLPRRGSPSERENERGRNWGRLSPSRPQVSSSQQGRLRDRLSGRIQDERNEGRNLRGPAMRRDSIKDDGTDFAAPKSLAELKGTKQTDTKHQQSKGQQSVSGGRLRDTVIASSVGAESVLSFEGPKPLSEILKRKRDAGGATSTSGVSSGDKEENKHDVNTGDLINSNRNSAADAEKHLSLAAEQAQDGDAENKPMTAEGDEEEGEISNKKLKLIEDESSIPENKEQSARDEGLVAAGGEEQGLDEDYDQGDVEYEYEHDEGEGYNLNEGEVAEHEEDFMDEDDGDDFAKKLGVSI